MDELDVAVLPEEPPEGMFEKITSDPDFLIGALVCQKARIANPLTGMKEEKVKVTCSHCKEVFYADEIVPRCSFGYARGVQFGEVSMSYGEKIACPSCGGIGRVENTSHFYGDIKEIVRKKQFAAHAIEGRLILAEWIFRKVVNRRAEMSYETCIRIAYVLEHKKMNLFQQVWKGLEKRGNCYDNSGEVETIFGLTSQLLEGTTAENSKLDVYMKGRGPKYPISYLRLWQKKPNIENLIMQGCGQLVGDMMNIATERANRGRYYGADFSVDHRPLPRIAEINWNEVRPSRMLGLSVEEFRLCVHTRWTGRFLMSYRALKEKGVNLTEEDIKLCQQMKMDEFEKIVKYEMPTMKTVRYLLRQKKKYPKDRSTDVASLRDYWEMAAKAELDISLASVKWPQRLQSAHDQAILLQKFKEEERLIPKFQSRFVQLMELAWEKNGIFIRPAETQSELKREGEYLHHCVAGYAERHANGGTAIFFIRRSGEPEVPWYTLELDEKNLTVRQNRGKHNCARTEEITEFENLWLEEIKVRRNKQKRGHVA
jgi:hypothetical protein